MTAQLYDIFKAKARRALTYRVGDALITEMGTIVEITRIDELEDGSTRVWAGSTWWPGDMLVPTGRVGAWYTDKTPAESLRVDHVKTMMENPKAFMAAMRGDDLQSWGESIEGDFTRR